jgi:hypothetical protein
MSLSNDDDWSALSNMLPRNAAASGSSPHQGEAEPESDPGLMARRLARMGSFKGSCALARPDINTVLANAVKR